MFQEILDQGYQIKFVTFNVLKNLLRIRFEKEQEKGISNLKLNHAQLARVKQKLS